MPDLPRRMCHDGARPDERSYPFPTAAERRKKSDDAMRTENETYDVIIVGAGWAGLLACKYCLGEGLKTLVLESRDSIGGVWTYTDDRRCGGVMKTTETTSSRCITEISDFPMPADYPHFPSHSQIKAYLESYCKQFSLTEHIRFNCRVTRLWKVGDLWQMTTSDGTHLSAKNVIVCSGVNQHINDVSGDDRFRSYAGTLMHSAAVKEITAEYSGKTIVVWGGGESASDIAYEASRVTSSVYWCIPNGQWLVPKVVDQLPPFPRSTPKVLDHTSSRVRQLLSPTHQYSPFISQYLEFAWGFNGHGQEAWRTDAPYNRSFFNKSRNVLSRVKSGHIIPKRDIAYCRERTVHFTDGTSADADYIITCSGYRAAFPFFDQSVTPGTDPRKWFKYIFYNEDPSLAFVGFVRPIFGSIPGIAEMQSRYVAKVFSGKCQLPDPVERRATIDRDATFWNRHFRYTSLRLAGLVDHFLYCDQLARLIGCYPNWGRLFLSSPRRWWQAITAPWNGCQFWLNDVKPHDRIFETFRRYHDNRMSQLYIFVILAPILPFIGLFTHLRVRLRDHFVLKPRRQAAGGGIAHGTEHTNKTRAEDRGYGQWQRAS
jgi:dimethylaniline monooxygenase (N-oxide forming) / hypotaurine monooxygenase